MNENGQTSAAYGDALTYLYGLINFERERLDRYSASKLDATRPARLAAYLGSPQAQFPAIHIAGTKGKGSVAAMTTAVLRAAGLRVGLYTSPHLQEFRERIRIVTPDDADGRIPEDTFVALVEEMKTAIDHIPGVTWFEAVTAIALLYFARQQVDVAVIETGLGGRLDATRVVNPLVSVITSLSLDHTDLLGDTLAAIAYEKAGIIKPGIPVVSATQEEEALARLREIALERESPFTAVNEAWQYHGEADGPQETLVITRSPFSEFIPDGSRFPLALAGAHQVENSMVAVAALCQIRHHFPMVGRTAVSQGLAQVEWNGRLQTVHQAENSPDFLVDCAHNPDSIGRLVTALNTSYHYQRLILLFGAPADKDISEMLALLVPLTTITITTAAEHPRAADPHTLAEAVEQLGGTVFPASSVRAALETAWEQALPGDLICATGSIIFIGDLLNQWDSLKSQLLPQTTAG
jgi:dihydrofolate synthase/folylpolyglutamate synthase